MISIVIPCYNEELCIEEIYRQIVINISNYKYEIIFVNDGSTDKTKEVISNLCILDSWVKLVNLDENKGQQTAILHGLDKCCGDAVIIMDADLQDNPKILKEMIQQWIYGSDVVHAVRIGRIQERIFKRATAWIYYNILYLLSNKKFDKYTSEFKLIDRSIVDKLLERRDFNKRYIRGEISKIQEKPGRVEFVRKERFMGESKYSLIKMIKLGIYGWICAFRG